MNQSQNSIIATSEEGKDITFNPNTKKIKLNSQIFPVYPRYTFFIAGPPGCGKSYFISRMLKLLNFDVIYLFTLLDGEDENFEGLTMHRININSLGKISLSMLKEKYEGDNICCIFDDIDSSIRVNAKRNMKLLIEEILGNGRAHQTDGKDISLFLTYHTINNYKDTKFYIENCDYIVLFPEYTLAGQIELMLKKVGLEQRKITYLKRNKKRILIIHKTYPFFIINFNEILF